MGMSRKNLPVPGTGRIFLIRDIQPSLGFGTQLTLRQHLLISPLGRRFLLQHRRITLHLNPSKTVKHAGDSIDHCPIRGFIAYCFIWSYEGAYRNTRASKLPGQGLHLEAHPRPCVSLGNRLEVPRLTRSAAGGTLHAACERFIFSSS